MKQEIMSKLAEYKASIESRGHIVFAIALKGSQNYNLSDEESDIDANAVIIPTLSDLRHNKSNKYTFDDGEVTCHNIYSFAEIVAKGNPQFIEVCNTNYIIGDLTIFSGYNINPSALKGMFMEKLHAFDKVYPSTKEAVEKYGYVPKQVHHLVRLYDILKSGSKIIEYKGEPRDWLLGLKRGKVSKGEAVCIMNEYKFLLDTLYESKKQEFTKNVVNYEEIDSIVMKYYLSTYCTPKDNKWLHTRYTSTAKT